MKQTLQQPHIHTSANSEIETCDICHHHHPHLPMEAPADETLYRLADLYKVFGDPTRIRILYALSGGELCVCDIAELLGMTQSAISHQLRVLKQSALVKFRRDGKTVYYSLADTHVATILAQGTGSCTGINMNFKSRLVHRTNYGYTKKREDRTP
jgi:ArsR family transcriptional regulator